MSPSIGRIVHVNVTLDHETVEELRPAVITRVWGESCVNLQVLLDGQNDTEVHDRTTVLQGLGNVDRQTGIAWCTSVMQGDGPGEWRWPARS